MKSAFIISLDFELFWGVWDATGEDYFPNVYGVWNAVPKILNLFTEFNISATWATVGMVMCKDYKEWRELIDPHLKLGFYSKIARSQYIQGLVKEYPNLFFAPNLINTILDQGNQELGSHSFGHFDCLDECATLDGFLNDLALFRSVSSQFGFQAKSFVFPRNNISVECIHQLVKHDFKCFRSNLPHILYANGHYSKLGNFGRLLRFADAYIPISSQRNKPIDNIGVEINAVPANFFLRPWSKWFSVCEMLKVKRIKDQMTFNAKNGIDFHLWWHPHNFGLNLEKNIFGLRLILSHYQNLEKEYGMFSTPMGKVGVSRQ